MRGIAKWLIALGAGAVLSGWVVAPVGPPRGVVRVGVAAPVSLVVVRGYYRGW